jgi:hypothetical protein
MQSIGVQVARANIELAMGRVPPAGACCPLAARERWLPTAFEKASRLAKGCGLPTITNF